MGFSSETKQNNLLSSEPGIQRTQYAALLISLFISVFIWKFYCKTGDFFRVLNLLLYICRYPYVTGSSVVALKYKDGILMAADMGG